MSKRPLTSLLVFLTCVISLPLAAQVAFEPGYLVLADGQRSEVLIENRGWQFTPDQLRIKSSASTAPRQIEVASLREFGLNDGYQFVKRTVLLNREENSPSNPAASRAPTFTEQEVFLRKELTGTAQLYTYASEQVQVFLIEAPQQELVQLVNWSYARPEGGTRTIQQYRQQLGNLLVCPDGPNPATSNLAYNLRDLRAAVVAYNSCTDPNYVATGPSFRKSAPAVAIRATLGARLVSYRTEGSSAQARPDAEFNGMIAPSLGVEFEYMFGYAKNRLSIFAEPNLYFYGSEEEIPNNRITPTVDLSATALALPLGVRYYIFPSSDSNPFWVDAAVDYTFNVAGEIAYLRATSDPLITETSSAFGLTAGVGYRIADKLGVWLGYYRMSDNLELVSVSGRNSGLRVLARYRLL